MGQEAECGDGALRFLFFIFFLLLLLLLLFLLLFLLLLSPFLLSSRSGFFVTLTA